MQKRPTVEDIQDTIRTRDMRLWGYDLMLDFVNASDFDALPEIGDIIEVNQVMNPVEKARLIEIVDSRVEEALLEMR